jgi:TatD DNase family protein
MQLLPFDSHNHVHMGASPPMYALLEKSKPHSVCLSGMSIMSTQPQDYEQVEQLSNELPRQFPGVQVVPCFGVHPWFLHVLTEDDWSPEACSKEELTASQSDDAQVPCWIIELEQMLRRNPHAIVGEIGIDGFHFDPTTKELVSPLDKQAIALCWQLELAVKLERPVSIHAVKSFGVLFDCLTRVKKKMKRLPPTMYFHAFGGKEGIVDQLTALCGREPGRVYFGFAPVVNFRSPKTAVVVEKVGLARLVLESDHEDAALVPDSIAECVRFLADVLNEDEGVIIEQTTRNAFDLYNLTQKSFNHN